MAAEGNEYVLEAFDEIVKLSEKEEQRIAYERREKVLRDHNSFINGAKRISFKQGLEEGRAELSREIISGALKKGKSPEEISEFNDIPLEEVKRVQEAMLAEA